MLDLHDKFLSFFVNFFLNNENLKSRYKLFGKKSKISGKDLLIETDLHQVFTTGRLIKFLDLYGLDRPAELNYWDTGKPLLPSEPTNNVSFWLTREPKSLNIKSFPNVIKYLVVSRLSHLVDDNHTAYQQLKDHLKTRIGKKGNSPIEDLRHEVNNLIFRCRIVNPNQYKKVPSSADLDELSYDNLLKLYQIFSREFLTTASSVKDEDLIEWWGKYNIKQFLIMTLEHLALHSGNLSMFADINNLKLTKLQKSQI